VAEQPELEGAAGGPRIFQTDPDRLAYPVRLQW
jgi:hypothetical protein